MPVDPEAWPVVAVVVERLGFCVVIPVVVVCVGVAGVVPVVPFWVVVCVVLVPVWPAVCVVVAAAAGRAWAGLPVPDFVVSVPVRGFVPAAFDAACCDAFFWWAAVAALPAGCDP